MISDFAGLPRGRSSAARASRSATGVSQPMPDKRQVLPVVASTADGVEQRTIVIAVERNTKVLEPMVRESND